MISPLIILDSIDGLLDVSPRTPEDIALTKRLVAKVSDWCKAHPDRVPRVPHYRHTCLNPDTCTLDHDTYPNHP